MRYLIMAGITALALAAIGCTEVEKKSNPSAESNQRSVEQRATNFQRAETRFPQPTQENFPMREALVKYTERQDQLNHPWYVYVMLSEFTNPPLFVYFVGQTYPQSTCNFLGSTEEVRVWKGDGYVSVEKFQAPSLDGIYYGSGATTGGCDYFFFEQGSDAMQVIQHDWKWFVSDKLLLLNAQKVQVQP